MIDWVIGDCLDVFEKKPFVYLSNNDNANPFREAWMQKRLGQCERLPNTIHGLNSFQGYNNVAVFSALNPSPQHYNFLKNVAGMDADDVKAAGYRQAAYQASARISLRDLDNKERKNIVVMDKSTAQFIQRLYPGSTIRQMPSDLDDLLVAKNLERKKSGRKKKYESQYERQKAYRERKKGKNGENKNDNKNNDLAK